jgi:hypothetical protein
MRRFALRACPLSRQSDMPTDLTLADMLRVTMEADAAAEASITRRRARDAQNSIQQFAQQWLNEQASQRAEQIAQTAPVFDPVPILARRAPSFFRFTGSGAGVARDTVGTGFKKAKPLPLPD